MTPQTEIPAVPVRVSIIVVSHNRAELLRRCLDRLGNYPAHQVLVLENGSTDGSAQLEAEFPQMRFVRLPRNFGLTKALNIGLRHVQGEFILLLHEDVEIAGEAVDQLAAVLADRPDVGAVCPRLFDEAGAPAPQIRLLPTAAHPDPPFSPAPAGQDSSAACVTGAVIMVRAFFLGALRQFDERYGNYGSEIELCMQLQRAAKSILILDQVKALHLGGRESSSILAADRILGTAVYLGKHLGWPARIRYSAAALFGAFFRFRFGELSNLVGMQKIDGSQSH